MVEAMSFVRAFIVGYSFGTIVLDRYLSKRK